MPMENRAHLVGEVEDFSRAVLIGNDRKLEILDFSPENLWYEPIFGCLQCAVLFNKLNAVGLALLEDLFRVNERVFAARIESILN